MLGLQRARQGVSKTHPPLSTAGCRPCGQRQTIRLNALDTRTPAQALASSHSERDANQPVEAAAGFTNSQVRAVSKHVLTDVRFQIRRHCWPLSGTSLHVQHSAACKTACKKLRASNLSCTRLGLHAHFALSTGGHNRSGMIAAACVGASARAQQLTTHILYLWCAYFCGYQ